MENAIDDINELIEKIHTLNNYLAETGRGSVHVKIEGPPDLVTPSGDVNRLAARVKVAPISTAAILPSPRVLVKEAERDDVIASSQTAETTDDKKVKDDRPVSGDLDLALQSEPTVENEEIKLEDLNGDVITQHVTSQQQATPSPMSSPEDSASTSPPGSGPLGGNEPGGRERSRSMPSPELRLTLGLDGDDGRRRSAPSTPTISGVFADERRAKSSLLVSDVERRVREVQRMHNQYMNRKALSRILALSMDRIIEEKDEQTADSSTSSTDSLTTHEQPADSTS